MGEENLLKMSSILFSRAPCAGPESKAPKSPGEGDGCRKRRRAKRKTSFLIVLPRARRRFCASARVLAGRFTIVAPARRLYFRFMLASRPPSPPADSILLYPYRTFFTRFFYSAPRARNHSIPIHLAPPAVLRRAARSFPPRRVLALFPHFTNTAARVHV